MEHPPPTDQDRGPEPKRRSGLPLIAIGGVGALAAGLGIAWLLVAGDRSSDAAPPAAEGGLVIDSSGAEDGQMDPGKPLRCFVAGQYVGELTLTACAQRNGVATDALDVGLDQSGALAAAGEAAQLLTPLPPEEDASIPVESALPPEDPEQAEAVAGPAGSCWRHGGGRWRKLSSDTDLDGCVQSLFAGRCERPGGASYGRFGQQTLRLVAGRVEVSDDNRSFHPLAPQASDCSIPPIG